MDARLLWLVLGMAAFVGSHFLLSHPLRRPLVRSLGEKGFSAVYSLVAIGTFTLAVLAFGHAMRGPELWDGHAALPWALASLLTYIATALLLASLTGNPALPGARVSGLSAVMPKGVFQVTRHPMMFSFMIWALAHILIAPTARGFVFMGGLIVLALGGSHLQDRKKEKRHGRDWRTWVKRTSFWPDLSKLGKLGSYWIAALLPWLAFTWLHMPFAHERAGIWALLNYISP